MRNVARPASICSALPWKGFVRACCAPHTGAASSSITSKRTTDEAYSRRLAVSTPVDSRCRFARVRRPWRGPRFRVRGSHLRLIQETAQTINRATGANSLGGIPLRRLPPIQPVHPLGIRRDKPTPAAICLAPDKPVLGFIPKKVYQMSCRVPSSPKNTNAFGGYLSMLGSDQVSAKRLSPRSCPGRNLSSPSTSGANVGST